MNNVSLQFWTGQFGKEYTNRNQGFDYVKEWDEMMKKCEASTILEIGCNRGMNLEALRSLGYRVSGVEPSEYARSQAKPSLVIVNGTAQDLPFEDKKFDLVFTAGVLIHIPFEDLPKIFQEMDRVSKKYILFCEYFAEEEEMVKYRGYDDQLWKRNYKKLFMDRYPNYKLISEGEMPTMDNSTYWLFEK